MILASSFEVAAIQKPGLKEWNVFRNRLWDYKVCCDTSSLSVCKFKQLLGSQNLLWERSLQTSMSCQSFYSTTSTITSRKTWKAMQEFLYLEEQSSLGSASVELMVTSRALTRPYRGYLTASSQLKLAWVLSQFGLPKISKPHKIEK